MFKAFMDRSYPRMQSIPIVCTKKRIRIFCRFHSTSLSITARLREPSISKLAGDMPGSNLILIKENP